MKVIFLADVKGKGKLKQLKLNLNKNQRLFNSVKRLVQMVVLLVLLQVKKFLKN